MEIILPEQEDIELDIELEDNDNNIQTKLKLLATNEIFSETMFIDCSFLLEYIYHKKYDDKDINFIIENALEIYSKDLIYKKHINNNKIKKILSYRVKLKVLNSTRNIPFNYIYFIINLKLKQQYYDDNTNLKILNISEKNITPYTGKLEQTIILENINNISYIWVYNSINTEHIIKYILIPSILTIIEQLTHQIKTESKGDWISIISTFILADIALIFTIPETNSFTISEKILYINFCTKIFIGVFAFYDMDITIGDDLFPEIGHHGIDTIIIIIIIFFILFYTIIKYLQSMVLHKNMINIFINNKVIWDFNSINFQKS
jgi:hypothetical protein